MTRRARYAEIAAGLGREQRDVMRYHLGAQRQVGEAARTVLQHPGYQIFVDHLDAQLDALTKRMTVLQDRIMKGPELSDALTALKLEVRDVSGEIRGLLMAKNLIPQMIEAGDKAIEALAGLGAG